MKPSIALIINTYDQPDYLRRVLRAISGQVSVPAEVLHRRRLDREGRVTVIDLGDAVVLPPSQGADTSCSPRV